MVKLGFIKMIPPCEQNGLDGYNLLVKIDGIEKNISVSGTFLLTENINDKEDIFKLSIYFFYKYRNLEVINISANFLYDYSFKDISLNNFEIID